MEDTVSIGAKVKALRTKQKFTLKQLSEETGLSIGFLSQLERGLSNIAVDSLMKIARVFGVSISDFFVDSRHVERQGPVRSYDVSPIQVSPQILSFIHSNDVTGYELLPRVYHLLPIPDTDNMKLEMYSHSGEEFIYVLEGIVTLYVGPREYELYPGDSIQIKSHLDHNWINRTNKSARILAINFPNPMPEAGTL